MISKSSNNFLTLDLRGIPCPINFIRCRLAVEDLIAQDCLEVYLDMGEPENTVVSGLLKEGHQVEIVEQGPSWIKLRVICGVR